MKLKVLSLPDLEQVRLWRNEQLESLRTPFPLAEEQQKVFYETVVCNRQINARYWGIWVDTKLDAPAIKPMYIETLVGMCGIENIQWENRLGEISLLLNDWDKFGKAVHTVLWQGFMNFNLENIYTEIYECNPAIKSWLELAKEYKSDKFVYLPILPNRKYFGGKYYDSIYLNFTKEDFQEHENIISKSTQTPD